MKVTSWETYVFSYIYTFTYSGAMKCTGYRLLADRTMIYLLDYFNVSQASDQMFLSASVLVFLPVVNWARYIDAGRNKM